MVTLQLQPKRGHFHNLPVEELKMVNAMWLLWTSVSALLFGLMIYRGMLMLHESMQVVLSDVTECSFTHAVHRVVIGRLTKIEPAVGVFAGATVAMSFLLVSAYFYNALEVIHTRMIH
jgi:hypothetical protein